MNPPAPCYIITLIVYTLLFHQPDLFTPVLVDLFPVIARSRPDRLISCHCVLSTNNLFLLGSIYLRTMLKKSKINKIPYLIFHGGGAKNVYLILEKVQRRRTVLCIETSSSPVFDNRADTLPLFYSILININNFDIHWDCFISTAGALVVITV